MEENFLYNCIFYPATPDYKLNQIKAWLAPGVVTSLLLCAAVGEGSIGYKQAFVGLW